MKPIQKTLLETILNHGSNRATKSKELTQRCRATDREVRLSIRELIADGIPIASSTDGKTGGYFIAETKLEAEDYIGKLRHRIIEDCLRLRDFKRASKVLRNPDQMYLL